MITRWKLLRPLRIRRLRRKRDTGDKVFYFYMNSQETKIHYDAYINFLDVIGDKIIFYKLDSDSDWEVWWVDKENKSKRSLLKKIIYICD